MSKTEVKCEVNTCTHWIAGLCGAANIDILNEEVGKMAKSMEHTECKTFSKRRGVANMLGSLDNVNWSGLITEPFLPGQQLTPTITCVVDSCIHWSEGNRCHADEILVTGPDANECQDTNCGTFKLEGR